jgi:hypothetical protein
MLFTHGLLYLYDYKNGRRLNSVTKDIIRDRLYMFVKCISGIEFCFDFIPDAIEIGNNAMIINNSDSKYETFIQTPLTERPPCLIKEGSSTYYSNDYQRKGRRKSTLKLYDREEWLLEKGNEYPADFIKNNPYKKRIEFVLKLNKNTSFLTFDNLDGTYDQIINRFIPYLAKLYKKYFMWKVYVNDTSLHPYFSMIYAFAHSDVIRSNKSLESTNSSKPKYKRYAETSRSELLAVLEKEQRNYDKLMKKIPKSYYANYMDFSQLKWISPFTSKEDIMEDISDNDFIFLKDNWQSPVFITIDE